LKFNPDKYRRQSIRLKGYDYTLPGAYFITICTQNRECLFGDIVDGEMRLNEYGKMVLAVWNEMPEHYQGVDVDAFVVMPNHIHGIVLLNLNVGAGPCASPGATPDTSRKAGQPQGVASTFSLPDAVHRFKSLTTARYRHGVQQFGWKPFNKRLWQRNYYERIIRDENELNRIRQYIIDNPANWSDDVNYPENINPAAINKG
jgi:REP element-mobilizing transposase RayT